MDYAITDIHGCNKTFQTLLDKIGLVKTDNLFLLGDYIDRGPDSKGVIDSIWQMKENGYQVRTLMGNHEQMLYDAYVSFDRYEINSWKANGGSATLKSFGVSEVREIPKPYIDFIETLEMYVELPNYYLVHAGFDFSKKTIFDNTRDMIWIRNWYESIVPEKLNGKKIVHGHTPMRLSLIQEMMAKPKYPVIDIDAGCFSVKEGYGCLCALNLTEEKLIWQARTDY